MENDRAADDISSAVRFLSALIGKTVAVTLVNHNQAGHESISGVLTHVFADSIVLAQHSNEQLIFIHAIASVQERAESSQEFLANVVKVQGAAASEYETLGKYIGE
jgi:sRNA-binding regulator protein Hfq